MSQQRKQKLNTTATDNLVSDRKITKKKPNGGSTVGMTEYHHSVGSSRGPSSPTSAKDISLYDSGRTDSGFLSGALSSELDSGIQYSSDNLSDFPPSPEIHPLDSEKEESNIMLTRLDSGVDVGLDLTDNFSGLNLDSSTSLNDLNSSSIKSNRPSEHSSGFTNISVYTPTDKTSSSNVISSNVTESDQQHKNISDLFPAWELYFQQDEDGDTQLHIAIIQGFIEVVYSLIQLAPKSAYLDIFNFVGQTPLHLAVLTRQPHVVRRLLVAGANVLERDREGNTPLHLACRYGDVQCVMALIEPVNVAEMKTANLRYSVTVQQVPQDLEQRNYDGQMCVHLATLGGHVDILRHLVWFGADINAREGKSGRTPLHYCIEYGITHVLQYLLSDCESLKLEVATYGGFTAYQLAACIDTALARSLVEKGALARKVPDSDSETDSDFGDEDEMYQIPINIFASHMLNNGRIDISA